MIARSYIYANLNKLEKMYHDSKTSKEALYFSKLALLELCGWVEESMDDLILRCAIRNLKNAENRKFVRKKIIKPTYGFDYEDHFRKMLIQLIGIINVEKIERKVDPLLRDSLKSNLSTLKEARNPEAHTHIKGVARTIDAPSVTLSHFPPVYDGLKEYERIIRAGNW